MSPPATKAGPAFWRESLAPHELSSLRRSLFDLATSVVPYLALSVVMYACLAFSVWITLALAFPAAGFLLRRNAIVLFMCIELMLNATNLALVAFARMHGDVTGQLFAFFIMVVAAAEVVIGLAIIMAIYRSRRSASVDDANLLRY